MTMSLCKKSFIHYFLASFTNTMTMDTPTNKSSCNKPPKKDPGGIGFIDDMGGGVNGLMSCTESLGFESSDERIDIQGPQNIKIGLGYEDISAASPDIQSLSKARWRKDHRRRHHHEVKKFPPPLSSFNRNGQPSFFLRSVSSDGRLELTEVRVDRPEILRASREDGRLRLLLIREDEETLEEEEDEEETLEEEERVGEWKVEGFRRCNEMMGHHQQHHQHNHMHVWSQQCVPTR